MYKKPSGQLIEINDHPANIALAEKLGWVEVKATKKAPAKKAAKKKAARKK